MSNFKPFRIIIAGRTVAELVEHAKAFVAEVGNEQSIAPDAGQLHIPEHPEPDVETPDFLTQVAAQPVVPVSETVSHGPIGDGEVDSRGIPWDERIHSASRAINKDKTWRTRRGVEPELVKKIEAELMRRPAVQTNVPVVPSPEPQVVRPEVPFAQPPPIALVVPQPAAPIPQPVVISPPAPSAMPSPTPPVATTTHSLATFRAQLVPTLAKLVADGRLTQEYINALNRYFGVEQIFQVNENQVAEMFENFVQAGLLTKVE